MNEGQGTSRSTRRSVRGMYIICRFGGAPRQCPRTSTAFHGHGHGVPPTPEDTPRASTDLPRASRNRSRASTEYCGNSHGNISRSFHGKIHGNIYGNVTGNIHGIPRQALDTHGKFHAYTNRHVDGHTHGNVRGHRRQRPRPRQDVYVAAVERPRKHPWGLPRNFADIRGDRRVL